MRPSIWETLGNRIVSIFIRIGHRTTYHRVEFYGSSENSKNCKGKTCKANKNRDILSASYIRTPSYDRYYFFSLRRFEEIVTPILWWAYNDRVISISKEDPRRWFDRYSWLPRRYRVKLSDDGVTKSSPLNASKGKMRRGGRGGEASR